jgi:hypothetical protein
VQPDPVPVGNKVPEKDSGATDEGGASEEGIEKIRVTINVSALIPPLLQELQKNNRLEFESRGMNGLVPTNGRIFFSGNGSRWWVFDARDGEIVGLHKHKKLEDYVKVYVPRGAKEISLRCRIENAFGSTTDSSDGVVPIP